MDVNEFIAKWSGVTGGAERANYGQFINDMCQALGLPIPGVAEGGILSDYQFEGPVQGGGAGGHTGSIDLYKRGCFVLEAKQSKLSETDKAQAQLFDIAESAPAAPSGARYDRLMRDALAQAKRYAVNLPASHPWPPFLIVCDVGRAFELYFDWSGNGRGYGYFPDQHSYRLELHRFADPEVQATIRAIWTDPASIDPRARSAEVSRDIAQRLAEVSKWLESVQRLRTSEASDSERSLAIEETALFLMRIIFCMFAEDVGLLPKASFSRFLERAVANEAAFEPELRALWTIMGRPDGERYASAIGGDVRYFNGGLFASAQTYSLSKSDRGELLQAAKADWTKVEPAIFGTLLEQALTPSERSKLGAHYTPRPYVERLVQATIMDVLEAEWEVIQLPEHGEVSLEAVQVFHDRLCHVRILDPACGTGNFLYVAMENLMRLESDVIETIRQLGGAVEPNVGPQQFLGLELNPRAAVIAELVLWIGWLRWRMANDPASAPTPVLKQFGNINFGGANSAPGFGYDAILRQTPDGGPDTKNPMLADWPEADFIVGNPPFIGKGQKQRQALGSDYLVSMHAANPSVPKSGNFFLQWWDRSASLLEQGQIIRFGLVTSNTISQTLNRKVLSAHLNRESPISIVYCIPDHHWVHGADAADVRIAMTVCQAGRHAGNLDRVTSEKGLDTDRPVIVYDRSSGQITEKLALDDGVLGAKALKASKGISSNGVLLAGRGFILTQKEESHLRQMQASGSEVFRPYVSGAEIMELPKKRSAIDFSGSSEVVARKMAPAAYQHLLDTVKVAREEVAAGDVADDARKYAENWWLFAKTRPGFAAAREGLERFIATTETTKYRVFQFLDNSIVTDHMIVGIASDDAFDLGVLSSEPHRLWTYANCGMMGIATIQQGHRYTKTKIFDTFAFPDANSSQRTAIAELAEELDQTRKLALAEVPRLTMTEIYNLRDRQRNGQVADLIEVERAKVARIGIIDRLHHQIDNEVAASYGWPADLPPAEIIARLVALNSERAAEEEAGKVRWLRPDYQISRFGGKAT